MDESAYIGFEVERHDWRPVWDLCRQIQEQFKGYKGFASKEEHQAAWDRFQMLRQKASRLADVEKANFAAQSETYRVDIVSEARACYWSASADFFVGSVLGETTVEEMKELQVRLKEAGQKLSRNKARMTREHKEECFGAIQDARESHDRFWEKYKDYKDQRRQEYEAKQAEFESKRAQWIERTNANIRRNQEKLSNAEDALNRVRNRISELEDKLYETNSEKWQGIFSEWLEEARSKERDIEESIERIEGWIREDEDKLSGS
ncbi:hypothetical protein [Sphingorhabdus pulchriflava]|nr:hypothetical protein [Sphingorhabdus pulchriflava]